MAITAVADAFEDRVDHDTRIRFERARILDRMREQSDHERYEADWPSVSRAWIDQAGPSRRLGAFGRR